MNLLLLILGDFALQPDEALFRGQPFARFVGVEIRQGRGQQFHRFVDIEVAKAAFSIPGHRKIEGRERKAVLKKAAEAWLPDEIIYRPKGLFSAPLRAWIRRDLSEMVDDVVVNGRLVAEGFLNGAEVRRMVEADRAGREDRSKEIWQFLTLELWQAQMREKFDPAKQVTR